MRRVRGNVQAKKCANLRGPAVKLEVAEKWRGTHRRRGDPRYFRAHPQARTIPRKDKSTSR